MGGFFPDFFDLFMGGGPVFPPGFPMGGQAAPAEDSHPPASRRFISTLPEVVITKEDLDVETSNAECAICLSDQTIGQLATRMPCGHLFCNECLQRWLVKSNTCPVCRYEVETDDANYEAQRMHKMKDRKMRFRHRELEAKSVTDLKHILRMLGVSAEGCIEKSDIIKRLEESPKVELVKTTTAQQVYSLSELMSMGTDSLRRLMQGLGVRVSSEIANNKICLIRALANSGRAIVSTEGSSEDEISQLQREASQADPSREPKLQRTHATAHPACNPSRAQLEAMRVGELKSLLAQRGLSLDGLLEKKDLIDKLLDQ